MAVEIPSHRYTLSTFGAALASLGDLDGDGAPEVAISASSDDAVVVRSFARPPVDDIEFSGVVEPSSATEVTSQSGSSDDTTTATSRMGGKGNGITMVSSSDGHEQRLVIGMPSDPTVSGDVLVLELAADGTVQSQQRIGVEGDGLADGVVLDLDQGDRFGMSVSGMEE